MLLPRLTQHGALVLLLVVIAMPAILGPSPANRSVVAAVRAPSPSPRASASPVPTPEPSVDPRPEALSLDMAVGQMMAASFGGPSVTDGLRHLILDQKVGTVLIFGDNFTDAASLGRLTAELQALGREAGLPAPLLVAVDEEGGPGMRAPRRVPPPAAPPA